MLPSEYDRSHLDDFTPGTSGYQDAFIASKVLALYPQPNVVAVPGVLEFYQGQAPNFCECGQLHRTPSISISRTSQPWTLRYNLQDLHQLHDDSLPSSSTYPGNGSITSALNQNAALTFTHQFSPNLMNEARVALTRF